MGIRIWSGNKMAPMFRSCTTSTGAPFLEHENAGWSSTWLANCEAAFTHGTISASAVGEMVVLRLARTTFEIVVIAAGLGLMIGAFIRLVDRIAWGHRSWLAADIAAPEAVDIFPQL